MPRVGSSLPCSSASLCKGTRGVVSPAAHHTHTQYKSRLRFLCSPTHMLYYPAELSLQWKMRPLALHF